MATAAQIASVRRYLYGGSTRTGTLSTDDIASFIDENSNLYLAASEAANSEALAAAGKGNRKVGDLAVDYGGTAEFWQAEAKKLRLRGVRGMGVYAGGISRADKRTQKQDSDWDKPDVQAGQFEYQGSESTGEYTYGV